MKITKTSSVASEAPSTNPEIEIQELCEFELALVGGGQGEVVIQ